MPLYNLKVHRGLAGMETGPPALDLNIPSGWETIDGQFLLLNRHNRQFVWSLRPMVGEKILLIDDQEDIRKIGQLSLRKMGGFDVHVAASGAEGIRIASEIQPMLILLDFLMPDLDGPATLARIREIPHCKETPVVFLTGKGMDAEEKKLRALKVSGVIQKPIDPVNLPAQVREFLST